MIVIKLTSYFEN